MPRDSRRALLTLLGSGTVALLAGCQTDSPTETSSQGSTRSVSSAEISTPTVSETETGTETETATDSPTQLPALADCAAVSRPEAAWPVPRRSPARDGYVADPDGFETAPAAVWEAEPSAPDDGHASPEYGQPVVAGDGLYVTKQLHRGPEHRMDGNVHALDTRTGERRWSSERLWSPSYPVAWRDLAVIVAEDENFNAMVVAFDRANGTRRWIREFVARESGFVTAGDHLYSSVWKFLPSSLRQPPSSRATRPNHEGASQRLPNATIPRVGGGLGRRDGHCAGR